MDARTWSLVLNTLWLAAGTVAISVPLGTLLACLLMRTDLPGRRAGLVLVAMMLFVPPYLQAAAWQAGFGVQGWFHLVLGVPPWLQGMTGAVWVHAMAAVPWVALIVGAGLWLVEPELEEQALLDGSAGQVFRHVTLRAALPAVGVAALWVAVLTAGEMTISSLFVVRTYAEELYTRAAVGPQVGEAPLGVWPGVVLTAGLVVAGVALLASLAPRQRPLTAGRRWLARLGRWRLALAAAAGAMLLLLVGMPLVNLAYKAGVIVRPGGSGLVRSWSPVRCLETVATSPLRYGREIGWSLLICGVAATLAVLAGVPLAWLGRKRTPARRAAWAVVLATMALCLAVPGPVLGLGVIALLNRPGVPWLLDLYDHSIAAPLLAIWVRGLPLAVLVLWHAMRTVPDAMLESAAVDGAGPLGRLVRVAIPNRLAALGLAWLVAFAVGLGELGASILVVPPGVTTLSIRIFDLLHSGAEDPVAGIALAFGAVFAALAGGAWLLAARWQRWTAERQQ